MAMHLDWMEKGLCVSACVRVCVCAELLHMNMHKQLNEEWSLSLPVYVCVRMCAVCFFKKKTNKDRKKATHAHTHTHTNADKCGVAR